MQLLQSEKCNIKRALFRMGCSSSDPQQQIIIFLGSARERSVHLGFVNAMKQILIDAKIKIRLNVPILTSLPFYNQDDVLEDKTPQSVKILKNETAKAIGIIFVSPELNGSTSSSILNAIAWLSHGNTQKSPLKDKKVGIVCGSYLSQRPISQLKELAKLTNMDLHNQSLYFFLGNKISDSAGVLTSQQERERLQKWLLQFISFVYKNV